MTIKNRVINFDNAKFRICLQRYGYVLNIAMDYLGKSLQTNLPAFNPKKRVYIKCIKKNEIGIFYVKDRMVCDAVASGFADLGIVGSDRIYEGEFKNKIVELKKFNSVSWPLVIAMPKSSKVKKISGIKIIATQYPKSVRKYFRSVGKANGVRIIKVQGSAEAMPYGKWMGKPIDAIADISITGRSLKSNLLVQIGKPIAIFHPVIIANKQSLKMRSKLSYYKTLLYEQHS
jgi:ATP phosphoribosyltransferase